MSADRLREAESVPVCAEAYCGEKAYCSEVGECLAEGDHPPTTPGGVK